MLLLFNYYLKLLATLIGITVILVPLLGFRRAGTYDRGRSSGAAKQSTMTQYEVNHD